MLTADVLTRAQELLNTGQRPQEVAQQLGLKYDTLRKAIQHSRLHLPLTPQSACHELLAAPYRSRFVIIFDREGYSPAFFQEMWQKHRIACISYHKFPQEDWPASPRSHCIPSPTRSKSRNGNDKKPN